MHNRADKTHLCVHKHIISCRFSEQLPDKPFQQSGSPLVSHSEGVSGSQDFRGFSQNQCQTLSFPQYIQSLTQTGIASFVSAATINGLLPCQSSPPETVKKILSPFCLYCLATLLSLILLGDERGERLSHQGTEGEERDGGKLWERSKGFIENQ